ncbi:MAG: hypothetical protein K2Q18_02265 [Bdellovibrionales bacterium]|nr:hypothetical protein [Bdellovibrionales bacterium]
MKIQKSILVLATLVMAPNVFAHCPSHYKAEKVCMMFEKDTLYIYDEKLEHNGPYKDLEKAQVTAIKSIKGDVLAFKKLARGIFKVPNVEVKGVVVEFTLGKKTQDVKVAHE